MFSLNEQQREVLGIPFPTGLKYDGTGYRLVKHYPATDNEGKPAELWLEAQGVRQIEYGIRYHMWWIILTDDLLIYFSFMPVPTQLNALEIVKELIDQITTGAFDWQRILDIFAKDNSQYNPALGVERELNTKFKQKICIRLIQLPAERIHYRFIGASQLGKPRIKST